jgi:XTP/dITP diphosphohydrolase
MILYCATGNPGKLREFQLAAQLEKVNIEVVPGLTDIPAPDESGKSFETNAMLKAKYYSRFAPGPVFCDDSGLEVDALGGAPGVYSARYAGEPFDDQRNNELLLAKLAGIYNRTARYVCVIAVARNGEPGEMARGEVEGEILTEGRGTNGFGYDPIFYYPPFGCTFGQAEPARKHQVSHRAAAFRKLLRVLLAKQV